MGIGKPRLKMPTKLSATLLVGALFLAACAPQNSAYFESVNLTPVRADTCGAGSYQNLLGQPLSALATASIADPKRVIDATTLVSTEFIPERINFRLDVNDRVSTIFCG